MEDSVHRVDEANKRRASVRVHAGSWTPGVVAADADQATDDACAGKEKVVSVL